MVCIVSQLLNKEIFMKLGRLFSTFFLLSALIPVAWSSSPVGMWITKDDKTSKKRAVIEVRENNNQLTATIVKVFPEPGDTKICSKCPGAFKGKPILGLQFAWGLKDKGNGEWADGKILDPQTGKIYRAKMTLEGNKLLVRGFIGFSLIGRTQTWTRA